MTSPCLLLFAGPNGSGKSTLTTPETLKAFAIPADRYINADDIAKTLLAEMANNTQEEREREAFRRARALRAAFRKERQSFAFETVFSHPSTLLDMSRCRALGFEIVVLFVTTRNVEINVGRVSRRYLSGGHDVPVDRIRSRYERTMNLLPRIVEDADRAFVYDNSREALVVYAYENGIATLADTPLPPFLVERLAKPLDARRFERGKIAQEFGLVTNPVKEQDGCTGRIVFVGNHYVVQKTPEGLLRHDLILFEKPPPDVGETVTIRYKDNAATLQK